MDQHDILHRVVCFLVALTRRLCRSIVEADEAPCGAVMGTREETCPVAGAEGGRSRAVESPTSGATTVATSASKTHSRCARAARE
jgi:hypothetical protein